MTGQLEGGLCPPSLLTEEVFSPPPHTHTHLSGNLSLAQRDWVKSVHLLLNGQVWFQQPGSSYRGQQREAVTWPLHHHPHTHIHKHTHPNTHKHSCCVKFEKTGQHFPRCLPRKVDWTHALPSASKATFCHGSWSLQLFLQHRILSGFNLFAFLKEEHQWDSAVLPPPAAWGRYFR